MVRQGYGAMAQRTAGQVPWCGARPWARVLPITATGTQTLAALLQAGTGATTGTGTQTLAALLQAGVGIMLSSGTGAQIPAAVIQTGTGECRGPGGPPLRR